MIFYDPTGFLSSHNFIVQGEAYSNIIDVYNKPRPRIAILDYLSSIEPDRSEFDLIIWYTLENFYSFKSRIVNPEREVVMTSNFQGADFCLGNMIYCTAEIYKDQYVKPNLNCEYTATMLIGRITAGTQTGPRCLKKNLNRIWIYYEFLQRGWQNKVIATVRDQVLQHDILDCIPVWDSIKDDLKKKVEAFGDVDSGQLPNYDNYESESVRQQFSKNLKPADVFGPLFSKRNLIPVNFYRNSYCDIIVQDYDQPGLFIDEKLTKSLMSGRLFVVIGPQHHLKNLRELGFQTFNSVIDESYDLEPDPVIRWNMAADQIDQLSKCNFQSVNDRLKKILKHNRKLACNSEYWVHRLKNWMNEKIYQVTAQANVIL